MIIKNAYLFINPLYQVYLFKEHLLMNQNLY